MERTYINEVQKEIGSTVKVQGFIENLRNSKAMAFIVLKATASYCLPLPLICTTLRYTASAQGFLHKW